jgi:hypothetical protein
MKRLPISLLILLLAILVLAVAFLVLDFKVARSNTTADSQYSTIRSGEQYDQRPSLVVYVLAPDNLAGPLRRQLVERLAERAPFSTVTSTETPAPEVETAALVVVVERRTYIWTPVYASADLMVRVAFASDGRVDWDEPGEIDTVMQTSPEMRLSGELVIRDSTLGLVSQPAYRNHVAGQVGDRVTETVNAALTNSAP